MKELPWIVIGSPPCAAVSSLQGLCQRYFADPTLRERALERLREGLSHLRFGCAVYKWQLDRGAHILHEHPRGAWSWKLPVVKAITDRPEVQVVCGDQCPFGLSLDNQLVQKPTLWATDVPEIAEALSVRCSNRTLPRDRHHTHADIKGRSRNTERYPPALVKAVLRACRKARARENSLGAIEAMPTADEDDIQKVLEHEELEEQEPADTLNDSRKDSTTPHLIAEDSNLTRPVYDEYTGLELPLDKVQESREEELKFCAKLNVWDVVPRTECIERLGRRPFGTRWVTHNKGDLRTLDIRSRLVVQETKKVSTIAKNDFAAVFSATPPLESLRFILSITMSVSSDCGEHIVLRFLDVSRAHPHVPIKRLVYIELPN